MINRILLIISLAFNVALYFGWIDVGQYRETVDNAIETGKTIITSEEAQNLLDSAKTTINEQFSGDLETITDTITDKLNETVSDVADDVAKEVVEKTLNN